MGCRGALLVALLCACGHGDSIDFTTDGDAKLTAGLTGTWVASGDGGGTMTLSICPGTGPVCLVPDNDTGCTYQCHTVGAGPESFDSGNSACHCTPPAGQLSILGHLTLGGAFGTGSFALNGVADVATSPGDAYAGPIRVTLGGGADFGTSALVGPKDGSSITLTHSTFGSGSGSGSPVPLGTFVFTPAATPQACP